MTKIKKLTKKALIEIGGKLWEKKQIERVYLNAETCKKIIGTSKYTEMQEECLRKAKTFFDCKTNELKSDTGTVRVMFNQQNIICKK